MPRKSRLHVIGEVDHRRRGSARTLLASPIHEQEALAEQFAPTNSHARYMVDALLDIYDSDRNDRARHLAMCLLTSRRLRVASW